MTAKCFQVYLNFFGIKQLKCNVGHPQTNTHCGKVHSAMKQIMRAFVTQIGQEWDEGLPHIIFAYKFLLLIMDLVLMSLYSEGMCSDL